MSNPLKSEIILYNLILHIILLLLKKGKVRIIHCKIKGIKRLEGQKMVGGTRHIAARATD